MVLGPFQSDPALGPGSTADGSRTDSQQHILDSLCCSALAADDEEASQSSSVFPSIAVYRKYCAQIYYYDLEDALEN